MLVSFLWSLLVGTAGLLFQGGIESSGTWERPLLMSCTVQCGASLDTGTAEELVSGIFYTQWRCPVWGGSSVGHGRDKFWFTAVTNRARTPYLKKKIRHHSKRNSTSPEEGDDVSPRGVTGEFLWDLSPWRCWGSSGRGVPGWHIPANCSTSGETKHWSTISWK